MKIVLIVIGHPYWSRSVANKGIVESLGGLDLNIVFSNIKELYPEGDIDVDAEQKKLLDADVVVFQFPIMWFGAPSLMHKYMEEVFTYGFAYGKGGDNLKGKQFIVSFTAGAPEDAYCATGAEGYTMDEFMPPISALAHYCSMHWAGYVGSYGMMNPSPERCSAHASRLLDKIDSI